MSSGASCIVTFLQYVFEFSLSSFVFIWHWYITHTEKRICILVFVVVWHSMQNGFNLALLFFVKTYLNLPLQANKL